MIPALRAIPMQPIPDPRGLRALLPTSIGYAEQVGAFAGWLHLVEADCLATMASARRRSEFAAGRWCAKRALSQFLASPQPVPSGPDRAPVWPHQFTGSITHTRGFCAAAAAPLAQWLAIGIDAEEQRDFSPALLELVCTPEEQKALARTSMATLNLASVFFSAKESFYKAVYPLTGMPIDFQDVCIELDPVTGTFAAHWATAPAEQFKACTGSFVLRAGLVLSAVVIPALALATPLVATSQREHKEVWAAHG